MSIWFWILVAVFVAGLWFFWCASEWKLQCEHLPVRKSTKKVESEGNSNSGASPYSRYKDGCR